MPRILTAEDTRLSDIQKSEIEVTNSIVDLIKAIDEGAIENSDKPKLMAALLNRVSNDDDIVDALNLHKMAKSDESEDEEASDESSEDEGGEEDFDFNM